MKKLRKSTSSQVDWLLKDFIILFTAAFENLFMWLLSAAGNSSFTALKDLEILRNQ
jgi:hypothetical protein